MEKTTAVIFDLGRVLVKIHTGGEKFGRLMRAMGIEPEQAFSTYWASRELEMFCTGKLTARAFYQKAMEKFRLPHSYDEFVEGWCDIFDPCPEMETLFSRVARRCPVGLLSDTDPLHWNHLLGRFPWLGQAVRPALSFRVGALKPHPDMYEAAARALVRRPGNCLFIDDLQANVDGARRQGMQALRFEKAEKLEKDLAERELL